MDNSLIRALKERILVLDGGFGTMLQSYNLANISPEQRVCNDLLSITSPRIVEDIHFRYLEAGADIIETNSFNANAVSLSDYNLQDKAYAISSAAARIARSAVEKYSTPEHPRFVAGSVGPTNRTLSMSADINSPAAREVTFVQMYDAYKVQIQGLIDGGVDAILIETIFDSLNAKAAIAALRDLSPDMPLMVSATVSDASGRLLSGQTIEAFASSVMHGRPISLGLNCGFGAKHLLPYLRRLAAISPVAISVHPNAGLPNVLGGYDETPEMFVSDIEDYLKEKLINIVGGCCGTTPSHIQALKKAVRDRSPRQIPESQHICILSGLETLSIRPETNFVNVGERTNVAGSAKFARLIREGNYDEALSIARKQVEAGAQIVDVCMDDAMIDSVDAMRHFLNLMASEPEIARVPVMIDSSKWEVIEAGLQCTQGKSIVNSISLKEGEDKFLSRARKIMNYGAAAVVMLFDEQGQADTYQRKIDVASRAYQLLRSIDFPAEDIIFDPNILAVGTGMPEHDRYALDFIEATRWIKSHLPHVKVSGGVSNLSFAFRGNNEVRKAMHAIFLYHAITAGMDMAIVNPQMVQLYDEIDPELLEHIEDIILYRRTDAADRLIALAKKLQESADNTPADKVAPDHWRTLPISERISIAMLKGDTSNIANDAMEAYNACGDAVEVIDTMLMPAMTNIGRLFADGKMFLPQVVKSARVMKLAVAALEPYFKSSSDADKTSTEARPIVIATVKGDVHDIGKNIVSVVLGCNGYKVIDLGVMTPAETIIEEAKRHNAAAICLSGLITPSLDEMINVAREADRQGIKTPIVVGGATTSALHTAVKIAPATSAPVIHSTDAADNARIMSRLYSADHQEFINEIADAQARLRAQYYHRESQHHCPCCMPPVESTSTIQQDFSQITEVRPTIEDVVHKINWSFFFAGWGIPGHFPEIFNDEKKGVEARRLYDDAQIWLKRMINERLIELQGVMGTFSAHDEGNNLVIDGPGFSLRRLTLPNDHNGDFVKDLLKKSGNKLTLFALTAGVGTSEFCQKLRAEGDDFSAIMVKLLCDRLAEAFADTYLDGGCRLAIGYPSIPDHALKRDIFDILDVEGCTDMSLTETNMIVPGESICGIYFK